MLDIIGPFLPEDLSPVVGIVLNFLIWIKIIAFVGYFTLLGRDLIVGTPTAYKKEKT
jgi:hypothetical protein